MWFYNKEAGIFNLARLKDAGYDLVCNGYNLNLVGEG